MFGRGVVALWAVLVLGAGVWFPPLCPPPLWSAASHVFLVSGSRAGFREKGRRPNNQSRHLCPHKRLSGTPWYCGGVVLRAECLFVDMLLLLSTSSDSQSNRTVFQRRSYSSQLSLCERWQHHQDEDTRVASVRGSRDLQRFTFLPLGKHRTTRRHVRFGWSEGLKGISRPLQASCGFLRLSRWSVYLLPKELDEKVSKIAHNVELTVLAQTGADCTGAKVEDPLKSGHHRFRAVRLR